MTPGHFAVLILAAIGIATVIKWMVLLPFVVTGISPRDFINHCMNDDFRKLSGRN